MYEITHEQSKELIQDYAAGMPMKKLTERYGISRYLALRLIQNNEDDIAQLQFNNNAVHIARENRKIAEVKEAMINHAFQALKKTEGNEKMTDFQLYETILNTFDKIQRLNDGQATEHTQTDLKTTHLDVAETLKQLKTTDDKKEYLLNQIEDVRNTKQRK